MDILLTIIGLVGVLVGAILTPLVQEWLTRHWFAPELKIEFQLAPPYCHKTVIVHPVFIEKKVSFEPVYYFKFAVTNIGKTQARLCEAVIDELFFGETTEEFRPEENFSPLNLKWSYSGEQFMPLNPGKRVFCDIGHIRKSDLNFCFDFLYDPIVHFTTGWRQGNLKFKVSIYSENAKTIQKEFLLSWSGDWEDTEDEMFKKIVLKPL